MIKIGLLVLSLAGFVLALSGCGAVTKKVTDVGRAALQCAPAFVQCVAAKYREAQGVPAP